ncbi:hypothetical protein C8F04DRAFT_942311 [Mycena alexandri]|uniref:Uncharacterized protein n=1 Tax=Mycena alexandri TaxID=1745969 RepID=A0AAD6TFT0_9AGAR|nr:hypothetical protein C8F04DRAFT_942311 [Mycena alexandri]
MENALSGFSKPFHEDLERLIFELAALSRPLWIPTLMLVARRVKYWVEPLLYRVVFVASERQIHKLRAYGFPAITTDLAAIVHKPPQFFANAVHSLNFDHIPAISHFVISLGACTGLTKLVLSVSPGPQGLHALSRLNHLRRLELVADGIDLLDEDPVPVFPCLTHLELMVPEDRSDESDYSDLEKLPRLFPRLTHFALCSPPTHPWSMRSKRPTRKCPSPSSASFPVCAVPRRRQGPVSGGRPAFCLCCV